MPKSRKRHPSKRHPRKTRNPLAVDRMFDRAVDDSFKVAMPEVLYHYTDWQGAEGILKSQQFWATAHDCTNDEAELRSADAIVMEVASDLRKRFTGAATAVLDLLLDGYKRLQVTELRTVYLSCFSVARDDSEQWRKYADTGRGVCLGVRILNEPGPKETDRASAIIKVDYSEASWRANLAKNFSTICAFMQRARNTSKNIELGLSALYRIAAFASIQAKQEKWEVEQEYRHTTIIFHEADVQPSERVTGGKTIRFLPVAVRANSKRIALAEIIVGPNQNCEEARQRLIRLLAECGYEIGQMEYPEITASKVVPWSPAVLTANV
jgi:hypothetical protein